MRKRWNKGCFVKSIIKSYSIMRKKIKSGPTQIVLIVGHCVDIGHVVIRISWILGHVVIRISWISDMW